MDIDAVIAEAMEIAPAATAEVVDAQSTKTEAGVKAEPQQSKVEEADEVAELAAKPDSELTPEQLVKREANRQSHRNSREAKLRRELRELRDFKASLDKPAQPAPATDNSPKEEDFDSFLDFVKATAKHEAKQELAQQKTETPKSEINPVQSERIQQIAQQATEFAQRTPEYVSLYKQHGAFMENLPETIETALFEADNAPLALYALMKEGRLEDLEDMSPTRIAMELGRAEERGKQYLNTTTRTTNAPPLLTPLKGTAKGSKSIEAMSSVELMQWVAS